MFSKATEYALRATIFIARKSDEDAKLSLDEVAKGINSPRSFTAKILQKLTTDNRIVSSMRGPNGGFFMTDKAKGLPARAILEVMQEDQVLEKCVLGLKQCSESKPCPMHAEYKSIKARLKTLFETTAIRHLADELDKNEGRAGVKMTILSQ
jgi:Rrf2 family protein